MHPPAERDEGELERNRSRSGWPSRAAPAADFGVPRLPPARPAARCSASAAEAATPIVVNTRADSRFVFHRDGECGRNRRCVPAARGASPVLDSNAGAGP